MKTFHNKSELMTLCTGKTIYLWVSIGFIKVTRKAVNELLRNKKEVKGTYEVQGVFLRIDF